MRRRTMLFMTVAGTVALAGGLPFLIPRPNANAAEIAVYKDPNCGCCGQWVAHLRAAGFSVKVHDATDIVRIKREAGIPDHLQSCHTAMIDGYVIEGHVPAADIERLLSERPAARGLAVPGMPVGSPGMEQGAMRDPYDVILFQEDGTGTIFARY